MRAVDPANPRAKGCLYAILKLLGVSPAIPPPYGNCLGEVKPRTITFPASGDTGFESFELNQAWPLGAFKTGRYDITWQWQFRLDPGGSWQDFETTRHRVYLVLETPGPPWQQTPYNSSNTQLPWTEALDKACLWASGAATKDEAAAKITSAINTHPLQSYTPMTLFGFSIYYLSSYMQMMDGGSTFQLNFTNCADAVTTFANLLGCDLIEGRFFNMKTRKFLTLNGNPSAAADWVPWNWSYHEICWLGAIGQNELIYDGCLQVDMRDDRLLLKGIDKGEMDIQIYLLESGREPLSSRVTVQVE